MRYHDKTKDMSSRSFLDHLFLLFLFLLTFISQLSHTHSYTPFPVSHSRHKTRLNSIVLVNAMRLLVQVYSYRSPSFPSYAPSSIPPAGLLPPNPRLLSLSPTFIMKESTASKWIMVVAWHWGQGVVYLAGTLQIHHKEMDKVPTTNQPGTLQTHSEFSKPISLQCTQYGKCLVHSQCPRSCDCDVLIR